MNRPDRALDAREVQAMFDATDRAADDRAERELNASRLHDFGSGGPVDAHRHAHGGGWVAATAHVDPTAFVGRYATVRDRAEVRGNARITGHAVVRDRAVVRGRAVVRDRAIVGDRAVVRGTAVVRDRARVESWARVGAAAVVRDDAEVSGGGRVAGRAVVAGFALVIGGLVDGFRRIDGSTFVDSHGNVNPNRTAV